MLERTAERKNISIPARAFLASLLSMLIPGLGQIYARQGKRGATILLATIIVGNMNAIWLSLFASANSTIGNFWIHDLPLLLHDLFSVYSLIFLAWQIVDAYQQALKEFYR